MNTLIVSDVFEPYWAGRKDASVETAACSDRRPAPPRAKETPDDASRDDRRIQVPRTA